MKIYADRVVIDDGESVIECDNVVVDLGQDLAEVEFEDAEFEDAEFEDENCDGACVWCEDDECPFRDGLVNDEDDE
jgi:hypothetical protein